jgi:hypothetical protein
MQKLIRHIGVCGYLIVASSVGFIHATVVNATPDGSSPDMKVRKHKSENAEQAGKRVNKSRQVRGTVLQHKQVKIKGTDLTNEVMLLRTQKGNKILVVDAGRSDKLSSLALDRGKQVTARGQVVTMKGQQVLVASDIMQGNQRLAVDRSQQLDQLARSAHQSSKQQK